MTRITTATRIVLVGTGLYVVDSFLPWNRACRVECLSFTLWHGIGILAALVAIGVVGWEAAALVVPGAAAFEARLAFGALGPGFVLFLTTLKIAVDGAYLAYGAWLGIVLAVTMGFGGYRKWREGKFDAPPAPGDGPPTPKPG